jgi:hypothetical protein
MEMNKTFSMGYEVITSTEFENFGSNWISPILYLVSAGARFLNYPMLFGNSCAVSGTAFRSRKYHKGKWRLAFHLLTEDIQFSVNAR